jgi:hypothetical protein
MYPPHVIASAYEHHISNINLEHSSQEANSPSEPLFTQPIKIPSTGDTSALISPHSPGVLVKSTTTDDATLCGVWQLDHSDDKIDGGPAASLTSNPPSKGEGRTQDLSIELHRLILNDTLVLFHAKSAHLPVFRVRIACAPQPNSGRLIFVPVTIFRCLTSPVINQNKQLMTQ